MLLVDIGNTRIKSALWRESKLASWPHLETHAERPFAGWPQALVETAEPQRVLLSNVAGSELAETFCEFADAEWGVKVEIARPQRHYAGLTTDYDEPARLGVDRWLAALAAWHRSKCAVCVVDMGTALTVDTVTADGHHIGGLIAPGLEMMRASLAHGTAQLASARIDVIESFATNTADAISLGCTSAVRGLLSDVRTDLAHRLGTDSIDWYITGGGAPALARLMPWPHHPDPELVLRGLLVVAEQQQ